MPAVPGTRERAYDVERTHNGGAIVRLYGETIAEYVVHRANKPFLWTIIGPTGASMTRSFPMARAAGETHDHVHQRGLAFGHQGIGGCDTWSEAATSHDESKLPETLARLGAIRHRGHHMLAGGRTGVIHARNQIVDAANKPVLDEERRMTLSFTAGHMGSFVRSVRGRRLRRAGIATDGRTEWTRGSGSG
jgi:hypothetical protein